ncbi:MAG: cbb3-type cytochrome oxidase assembly protein CcoS [Hyphomonadaceae bacterium]
MNAFLFMLPAAFGLALAGLVAFLWALKSGQFEDPQGDASRILMDGDDPE